MTVNLSALAGAGAQFFDNNGVILSGGKLYSYAAGTTTPQTTYTSANGVTAHTNPIILNSAGRVPTGEIWLTDGIEYKFLLFTSTNVLIATYDNIPSITDLTPNLANTSDPALGDALVGFRQSNSSGNLAGSVGRTVHQKLQESISVLDFGAVGDGVADDTAAIQNAITQIKTTQGGVINFPPGDYRITSTILVDEDNVFLQGSGGGGFKAGIASLRNSAATRIVWAGNAVSPMILFETPNGSTCKQRGGLSDLMLDCQNSAKYGLQMITWSLATFTNITIYGAVTAQIYLSTKPAGSLSTNPYDCFRNYFNNVFTTCKNLINTSKALVLGTGVGGNSGNSCYNLFEHCYFTSSEDLGANAANISLENTDNNIFFHCKIDRLHFQSSDQDVSDINGASRYNWVIACEGDVVAVASTLGGISSFGNNVIGLNNSNNNGAVFVGTGAQINASDMFGFLTKQKFKLGFVSGDIDPQDETQQIVISANDSTDNGAVWIRDNLGSAPSPYFRITSNRNDNSTSTQFSSRIALDSYRTDAKIEINKPVGTIQFGGSTVIDSYDRADVFYSSAIIGRAVGTFNSSADCPTNIEFSAGNAGFSMGNYAGLVRMKVKHTGAVQFVPLAAAPATAEQGDVYFDSVLVKLRCWNGSSWNDLF